ncbi:MAG: UDP-N-acetylmuramoyl-L-alanine--D-glutamate ligase [Acidimicrobiales bacterium]|nr:UDP-N-acetylmuramoyl-L-alanine--D-glutamate ligase [Acidimicrobiales bacterium]
MGAPLLVVGLGVTGEAVVRALLSRGHDVVVVEDRPTDEKRALAAALGVDLVAEPDEGALGALVAGSEAVLPSPGVPEAHPVFGAARSAGVPVRSEFDLAAAWDDRPLVAITGTNGKTTVTMLVTEMLERSGRRAVAAGNTEVPLVTAIDDPATDVFVVEASSFRLGHTERFAPAVATWLNFAPDHLDVHASLAVYEAAKARIWADQGPDDLAVANADDPVVAAHHGPARRVTFSTRDDHGFHVAGGVLVTDEGIELVGVDALWRAFPHDVANALAASATALGAGASLDGVRATLTGFAGMHHRVELVAERGGVRFYDDSKATVPHAVAAALAAFDSVVLIAGGRNKGIDLSPLAADLGRVRAVVAIGDAAADVEAAFAGRRPVETATSMDDAVRRAAALAEPGDAVLLSPGCASFDWYSSYGERGDDFARAVHALAPSPPTV